MAIGGANRNITKTKEFQTYIKEVQSKELNSETFREISTFIERYDRRIARDKEEVLFKIAENCEFSVLRAFLNRLTFNELNSNIYLNLSKKAVRRILANCNLITNELESKCKDVEDIDGIELEISVPSNMREVLLNRVHTNIEMITENGVECFDILDKKNIDIYKRYNEIVDQLYFLISKFHLMVINEMAKKANIPLACSYFSLETMQFNKKVYRSKYQVREVLEEVSELTLTDDSIELEDTNKVLTGEEFTNMSLYKFSYYLSNLRKSKKEKEKQKVFPN